MFAPIDILYIVLAFCALWLTAVIFWLVWQIATILKNVNDVLDEAKETMNKIEAALTGIRAKFESTSSTLGVVVNSLANVVEYVVEKKVSGNRKKSKKEEDFIDVE